MVQKESWVKKQNTGLIKKKKKEKQAGLKAETMAAFKLWHFTGLTKF